MSWARRRELRYNESSEEQTTDSRNYIVVRFRRAARRDFIRCFDDSDIQLHSSSRTMDQNVEVGPELRDAIKDHFKEEIQNGFDTNLPRILQGVGETVKQEIERLQRNTIIPSIENPIQNPEAQHGMELLKAQNASLEEENSRLKAEMEQLKQTVTAKLKDKVLEVNRLHKIILDTGLEDAGPTDDEIEKAFGALSYTIFQFVIKHCARHDSTKGIYGGLPAEAKNSYVVRFIALQIYKNLFDPEKRIFGFGEKEDDVLGSFEENLLKSGRMPYAEVTEWRVRTCQLSRFVGSDVYTTPRIVDSLAPALYSKLAPFWHYNTEQLKRRGLSEIKPGLEEIYQQALRIAFLFRRSKTEYRWLQNEGERDLKSEDVEVVATAGYESFAEARVRDDFRIVFGQVIKGTGPSGRIDEGSHLLRKCTVLLGPIPPSR